MHHLRSASLVLLTLLIAGCTPKQLVVRSSEMILPDAVAAMNAEPDLEIARTAAAANLKLTEGLLRADPDNRDIAAVTAQGFAGYALAFVENEDPVRAAALYRRGMKIGLAALAHDRAIAAALHGSDAAFAEAVQRIGQGSKQLLLWTAVCWGKWIDLSRTDPEAIADLPRVEALWRRMLKLDESYYYAAPHVFLGVFYGARSPMLGGRLDTARQHFQRAIALTDGKFLMARLYYAQYYARQIQDRALFTEQLGLILDAPDDVLPEMSLANAVAKKRAAELLTRVDEWFD